MSHWNPVTKSIGGATVKRVDGSLHACEKTHVYAEGPQATSGFCLYLNAKFDVDRVGNSDVWVERPGTFRPLHEPRNK